MGNNTSFIDLNENFLFKKYKGPFMGVLPKYENSINKYIDTLEKMDNYRIRIKKYNIDTINEIDISDNPQLTQSLRKYTRIIKEMKMTIESKKKHIIKLQYSTTENECDIIIIELPEYPKIRNKMYGITISAKSRGSTQRNS